MHLHEVGTHSFPAYDQQLCVSTAYIHIPQQYKVLSMLFCTTPTVLCVRCNFDERQRAPWVGIAHQGSHRGGVFVMGLHLGVPVKECIHRAEGRLDHPTLNGKDVVDVILK